MATWSETFSPSGTAPGPRQPIRSLAWLDHVELPLESQMKRELMLAASLFALSIVAQAAGPPAPNIVLVLTDDQGYGDLGHTGNPVIQTPHIDALAAESSQLIDFHVAPTCSPTRAALLTGHWTNRTGVWHTVNGRSMLRENEVTIAQMLKDAGYATGQFGKWHLGDNFPYRAEDRGFTEVYRHGGGGVGQTPDFWDNAYFDGHYLHNGKAVPAEGFCTDVFFEQAHRFIREQSEKNQPFFAYICTNAPHGPLHAPQKYLDLYPDQPLAIAAFFGMITNLDENVGATRQLLRDLGIDQNTLFIFTTDNGTAGGAKVFNAGMRGAKGSEYEGGHRVPLIAHWPAAGWNKRHVSDALCHAVDVVPTLLDVTAAKTPEGVEFDGISIRRLLDPSADQNDWPHHRLLVTDSQRVRDPIKWKQSAVMSGPWRLVNGDELYDIQADPGQQRNVIADHPARAAEMRAFYDAWWEELEPTFSQTTEILLGHPEHPVVSLTGHDWIQEALPPWNQQHIRQASVAPPASRNTALAQAAWRVKSQSTRSESGNAVHQGHWAVKVLTGGSYQLSVRRWPVEADEPINASLPAGANVPGATKAYRAHEGIAIAATHAIIRVDGRDIAVRPVQSSDRCINFVAELKAGSHKISTVFTDAEGDEIGAFYTIVTKLD